MLIQGDCWTPWFNRDNPGGTGDWEHVSQLLIENPGQICSNPIYIQVQTASGNPAQSTGEVFYRWVMLFSVTAIYWIEEPSFRRLLWMKKLNLKTKVVLAALLDFPFLSPFFSPFDFYYDVLFAQSFFTDYEASFYFLSQISLISFCPNCKVVYIFITISPVMTKWMGSFVEIKTRKRASHVQTIRFASCVLMSSALHLQVKNDINSL